jgi:hypothetical protein
MIRTIWLALLFLGAIAVIASFKFASSAIGNSVDSPGGRSEQNGIILKANGEQLAKADKLSVNVELVSYELETITPIREEPVKTSVDTTGSISAVGRQPLEDKASHRSSKSAMREVRKSRGSKRKRSAPTLGRVECQAPQTIVEYLNRSARCPVTSTTTAKRAISAK